MLSGYRETVVFDKLPTTNYDNQSNTGEGRENMMTPRLVISKLNTMSINTQSKIHEVEESVSESESFSETKSNSKIRPRDRKFSIDMKKVNLAFKFISFESY